MGAKEWKRLSTLAKAADGDKAAANKVASAIQGAWRAKQTERHVALIRLVYKDARYHKGQRESLSSSQDANATEVEHETGEHWQKVRKEVCGDLLSAVRRCCKVYRTMNYMKQDVARSAHIREIRSRMKLAGACGKLLGSPSSDLLAAAGHQTHSDEMWRKMFGELGADKDSPLVIADDKLFDADRAARRVQRKWTQQKTKQIAKALTRQKTLQANLPTAARSETSFEDSMKVLNGLHGKLEELFERDRRLKEFEEWAVKLDKEGEKGANQAASSAIALLLGKQVSGSIDEGGSKAGSKAEQESEELAHARQMHSSPKADASEKLKALTAVSVEELKLLVAAELKTTHDEDVGGTGEKLHAAQRTSTKRLASKEAVNNVTMSAMTALTTSEFTFQDHGPTRRGVPSGHFRENNGGSQDAHIDASTVARGRSVDNPRTILGGQFATLGGQVHQGRLVALGHVEGEVDLKILDETVACLLAGAPAPKATWYGFPPQPRPDRSPSPPLGFEAQLKQQRSLVRKPTKESFVSLARKSSKVSVASLPSTVADPASTASSMFNPITSPSAMLQAPSFSATLPGCRLDLIANAHPSQLRKSPSNSEPHAAAVSEELRPGVHPQGSLRLRRLGSRIQVQCPAPASKIDAEAADSGSGSHRRRLEPLSPHSLLEYAALPEASVPPQPRNPADKHSRPQPPAPCSARVRRVPFDPRAIASHCSKPPFLSARTHRSPRRMQLPPLERRDDEYTAGLGRVVCGVRV